MARKKSSQLAVGMVLLAIGGILLATRLVPIGAAPAWLLGLGLVFSLLAIVQRSLLPLIAGMVLLGLGAGMVLGDESAAGFSLRTWRLVALGLGFVGVFVLALVLGIGRHWWALVVGGVLVAVGLAPFLHTFIFVPPEIEAAIRTWWPAALVIAGLVLVVAALRR